MDAIPIAELLGKCQFRQLIDLGLTQNV